MKKVFESVRIIQIALAYTCPCDLDVDLLLLSSGVGRTAKPLPSLPTLASRVRARDEVANG